MRAEEENGEEDDENAEKVDWGFLAGAGAAAGLGSSEEVAGGGFSSAILQSTANTGRTRRRKRR